MHEMKSGNGSETLAFAVTQCVVGGKCLQRCVAFLSNDQREARYVAINFRISPALATIIDTNRRGNMLVIMRKGTNKIDADRHEKRAAKMSVSTPDG